MKTIILHSQNLAIAQRVARQIDTDFQQKRTHFRFSTPKTIDLNTLRQTFKRDFNYLPEGFNFKTAALLISDMDSTLINIECIDEIADFAHIKPQVAAITERAMLGELDFDAALIERVALLKGLDVAVLNQVYTQKLEVNPGGEALIQFLQHKHIKSAVVSGGFTYFTQRLANDIGLDHARANALDIENNRLTGRVHGAIVNAQAKADFVIELCEQYQISTQQVIAVGDGANDLKMMEISGLSVAYHAKPAVLAQANIALCFGGLDKITDLFDE